MARIGLPDYIDCKSTNGGDGSVVSCVGCETGHEVEKENLVSKLGITYLIRLRTIYRTNIRYSARIQMHAQLSDKKLGYSIRL